MVIQRVAVFHVGASAMASWNCSDGLVHALARMGYDVLDCGNPNQPERHVLLTDLQRVDLIILSAPEWYEASLRRKYGHAWHLLRCPRVAWYAESFHRDDRDFNFSALQPWAQRHYFPAAQDAAEFGGQWLPFGVDTTTFYRRPVARIHDVAFQGTMYPKRAEYIKRIDYPITILDTTSDRHTLAEYYSSTKIFLNLPTYSRLFSTKVTEVMACRTLLITPVIDHPSALQNMTQFEDRQHLVYYPPDRPEEIGPIVQHFLTHPEERDAIVAAGCREVTQHHTLEIRLQRIINDVTG